MVFASDSFLVDDWLFLGPFSITVLPLLKKPMMGKNNAEKIHQSSQKTRKPIETLRLKP